MLDSPLTIEGIQFAFSLVLSKIGSTGGESRRLGTTSRPDERSVEYETTFPGYYELELDDWWNSSDKFYGYIRASDDSSERWVAWYVGSYNTKHKLNRPMPLDVALRWLYMHETYHQARVMRSLDTYDTSIMRLLGACQGLHSARTYQELCGFTPASDDWKLYHRKSNRSPDNSVVPCEHFTLIFQGPKEGIIEASGNVAQDQSLLLLNPDNHLTGVWAAPNQHDRYSKTWKTTFTS